MNETSFLVQISVSMDVEKARGKRRYSSYSSFVTIVFVRFDVYVFYSFVLRFLI